LKRFIANRGGKTKTNASELSRKNQNYYRQLRQDIMSKANRRFTQEEFLKQ